MRPGTPGSARAPRRRRLKTRRRALCRPILRRARAPLRCVLSRWGSVPESPGSLLSRSVVLRWSARPFRFRSSRIPCRHLVSALRLCAVLLSGALLAFAPCVYARARVLRASCACVRVRIPHSRSTLVPCIRARHPCPASASCAHALRLHPAFGLGIRILGSCPFPKLLDKVLYL